MDPESVGEAPRLGELLQCPSGDIERALIRQSAPDDWDGVWRPMKG